MAQSSFRLIGQSIQDIRLRIKEISILVAIWYVPVQALQFFQNRLFSRYGLWRFDAIVDTAVFRLLYILVGVAVIDYFLSNRNSNDEAPSGLHPRLNLWARPLVAYLVVVAGSIPNAAIEALALSTGTTISSTLLQFPFLLLSAAMSFVGFLIVPIGMIENHSAVDAFKRSWKLMSSSLDRVIVAVITIGLISLVLSVPLALVQRSDVSSRNPALYFIGYLLFGYPAGFGVALYYVSALRFYHELSSDADTTESGQDAT